ncbi:fibronectin type III domain-containing protein, partial [Candidatus Parcubacteria bacterium]|nr:fibronectin type III domain-containing protein [Candidatus Parcubacteria bacterium]
FNSAITSYTSVSTLDSTHFVAAYNDVGNSNYGTAIVGEVSGTTISSYGAENVFNSAITSYISVSTLDSTHFVVAYKDEGNSNHGTAIVGTTEIPIPTVTTQAASSVEATIATGNGNITDIGGENCTTRGFCYMTGTTGDPTTADSVAFDAGSFTTGTYTKEIIGLTPGTNYRVRAYAINSAGTGYGTTVQILTKPAAPTSVSATDGVHTDKTVITWTKSTGATGYKVYEGTNLLDTLGDVATYDDTAATAPTITSGSTVAGDGTNAAHIAIDLSGTSANNGSSRTYKVVALNATGDSADSDTDTGYRGVGSLTYQWQRSAGDSDLTYSNITGAIASAYNDTAAPIYTINAPTSVTVDATSASVLQITYSGASITDGEGRYYQCVLNADGASQQTSSSNRGYRDDTIADSNGYEIFSDTESGGSYSTSEGLDTASTFDDTGLSSNTRKYYKVKTKSTDNVWSDLSSSYAGKYTLANIPTTLSLTTDSSTQITALWSDNSNPANTEYYIENSTAGTNSGWTTSTSWISPDLSCGTNYSFKVKSRNGENVDSNYTSSVSIETGGCASGMPSSAYNSPSPPEPTPENPENNFSLTINNGSEYTNDQIVTLKLISGPDTVRMAISNTSDFKYASQIDYQEEIIWDLCEKNGDNPACVPDSEFQISGSQFTVYAKFYTQYGVASETISVSINYISDLNENNLIIGPDGIKVYTINKNNYKRHIFNPTVFEMYLHLKWENIKKVSQTILDSFKTSDLYRTTGKNQVYFLEEIDEIKGKAIKHHLDVTPEDFSQKGYDWNEVFIANKKEDGYYEEGEEIQ